ncbi:recombination regulator RecX [Lacticaseibacillus jixiensis]|uniref:recombination regulator RecX n=1 Tax=Lacticaseibacillus jixiensis TaxID=3231926 RepID=UPI0036F39210
MPIITKITAQQRAGRFNLFLDGKYAFPISESTLVKFRLTKDMALDAQQVAALKAAEVQAAANTMALNYLARAQHTEYEVAQKLRGEQFPEAVVQAAVAQMQRLHYLNDAQYAQSFVADDLALSDKGPAVVAAKLRQKGVNQALIDAALAEVDAQAWLDAAMRAGKKAANQNQRKPYFTLIQKIKQSVMQKGFDPAVADTVVESLALVPDVEQENDRLRQEAAKQWRQKRQYSGYERRNRVKQALYRKGYQLDAIDAVLAEFEE